MVPQIRDERRDTEELERRLEAYRRYAVLVTQQAQALQDGDLERFQVLTGARQALQEKLTDRDLDVSHTAEDPRIQGLVARARLELEAAAEADRAILDALGRMRQETARDIRAIEEREDNLRRYVREDESGHGAGRPRINIRL